MADLGALRLLIAEQGGTAVLGRLQAIDKAGRQTERTFQAIAKSNALQGVANQARAGTTAMSRQISSLAALHRAGQLTNADTRLAVQLQGQLTAAMNAGNLSLQKRATLAAQAARLQKITAAPAVGLSPLAGAMSVKQIAATVGLTSVALSTIQWAKDTARAVDEYENSVRKIGASAKLIGVAESSIRNLARTAERSFSLSATTAGDLAVEITKLAAQAGKLDQSEIALRSFLELGAARGLDATQTLTAVRQALLGIDEGTDKLFGRNPSSLWKDYAASIGTTAGKLTDAQKQQALLTAAIRDGAKVQGSYAAWLETAAGRTARMAQANEALKVSVGRLFTGVRTDVATGGAAFLNWLADGVEWYRKLDEAGENWWRGVMRRLRGVPADGGRSFVPQGPPNPNARSPILVTAPQQTEEEKAAIEREKERLALMARQLAAVTELLGLRKAEGADMVTVLGIETALTEELKRGNVTLERRAEIMSQLAQIAGMIRIPAAPGVSTTPSKEVKPDRDRIDLPGTISEKMKDTDLKDRIPQDVLDEVARKMQIEDQFANSVASMVASGIANGFAQGIASGNIGEGMQQLGAQILAGFGSLMVDLGVQAIIAGKAMAAFGAWIVANPLLAIAIGAGLVAAGSAIGGRRGSVSTGGRVGGFNSGPEITHIGVSQGGIGQRSLSLPGNRTLGAPSAPVTINLHTVNPADPSTQRLLSQAMRAGERRGY